MKNYRKHIDDFFREKLGSYTETPPAEVWDDLSQRLEGLQPPPGAPGRWFLHLAIGSLLLVLGVSVLRKSPFNGYNPNTANENTVASTNNTAPNAASSIASAAPIPQSNTAQTPLENTNDKNGAIDGQNEANNKQAGNKNPMVAGKSNNGLKAFLKGHSKSQRYASVIKNTPKGTHSVLNGASNMNASGNIGKGPNANNLTQDEASGQTVATVPVNAAPVTSPAKNAADLNKQAQPNSIAKNAAKQDNPAGSLRRFELGVKGGYETGFNDGAASKYVISPYLQYNLSNKFSLMVQPAIKSATINNIGIGSTQGSYQPFGNGQAQFAGDVSTPDTKGTTITYFHTTTYNYTQSFVSTIKSYTYGGGYTEFELPLLLKYKLVKNLSVYGGVNIDYSRLVGLTEHVSTNSITISKKASDTATTGSPQTYAQPLAVGSVISAPTSETQSQPIMSPQGSMIRCGYMVGFGYEYQKKWLFDVLVQQTPAKADNQGSYNLNTPYSSTYFRFTIGYKILQ